MSVMRFLAFESAMLNDKKIAKPKVKAVKPKKEIHNMVTTFEEHPVTVKPAKKRIAATQEFLNWIAKGV